MSKYQSKFRVSRVSLEPDLLAAYFGLDSTASEEFDAEERGSSAGQADEVGGKEPLAVRCSSRLRAKAAVENPRKHVKMIVEPDEEFSMHLRNNSSRTSRARTRPRDNRSFYQKLDLGATFDDDDNTTLEIPAPKLMKPPKSSKAQKDENDNDAPPLRRSTRNRVKRLDPSVNQRAVYRYENGLPSLVGVTEVQIRKADRNKFAHYANFAAK